MTGSSNANLGPLVTDDPVTLKVMAKYLADEIEVVSAGQKISGRLRATRGKSNPNPTPVNATGRHCPR